jgi:putative toxin-antitoxin system antitoxin component (TIGR02293 family)
MMDGILIPEGYPMIHPERIAEVMGGVAILGSEVRSLHDLERSVSQGLPKTALRRTVERVYSTAGDVRAAIHRVVPEATFKRRTRLSRPEGERTERLARIIASAEYVLDDSNDAHEWLTSPHVELDNRTPIETAESELGARRVEQILEGLLYSLPL